MAIWQYSFHLVPAVSPDDRTGIDARILEGATQTFDKHLKRIKSWHSQISAWGDQAGDHIEVSRLSDGTGTIRVRIDMREIDQAFLSQVVETAKLWDCVFLTENNQTIPAKAAKLLAAMRLSPAHKFVEDPKAYFQEIAAAEGEETAE